MDFSTHVDDFYLFIFLDDEDFGGDLAGLQPMTDRLSCNFVDCIGSRELGLPRVGGNRFFSERLSSEYGTRHMLSNGMMKETSIGRDAFDLKKSGFITGLCKPLYLLHILVPSRH